MRKFFQKKFGPLGPPLGYLGSLSQKGLGKIFSKCVFLNHLSPLGLPIPSYALLPAKKLKKFPRGCGCHIGRLTVTPIVRVWTQLDLLSPRNQDLAWGSLSWALRCLIQIQKILNFIPWVNSIRKRQLLQLLLLIDFFLLNYRCTLVTSHLVEFAWSVGEII